LSCSCLIRVRDGGSVLDYRGLAPDDDREIDMTTMPEAPDQVDRRVDQLVEFVTMLEESLPPSAWEDREIRPHVPSRYMVCSDPVDDPSTLSAQVPAPAARILSDTGACVELGMQDTRALVEGLAEAGTVHDSGVPNRIYILNPPVVSESIHVFLEPLLPDGQPRPRCGSPGCSG
jgi:hypothetical protein